MVLPGTDLDGAHNLAERVREGIAALALPVGRRRDVRRHRELRRGGDARVRPGGRHARRGRRRRALRGQAGGEEPHGPRPAGGRPATSITCPGMGLLDDAIREHLELKRKHGADPTEVARQEREALGSGRVPPRPADPDAAPEAEPVAASGGLALDDVPPALPEDEAPPLREPEPEPRFEEPLEEETRIQEPRIDEPRGGVGVHAGRGRPRARARHRLDPPAGHRRPAARRRPRARPRTRTCSRRRRSSCRRRPSTTGSGSSSARPRTSTSRARGRPRPHLARRVHVDAADRQPARGRPRRRRPRRRDDARLRTRDAALGDDVRAGQPDVAGADYRNRIFMMRGELPFAGHPSLGTAVAVARARGERTASYVQQTPAGLQPIDVELGSGERRAGVDAPGAGDVRGRCSIPAEVLAARRARRGRRATPSCRRRSSRPGSPQVIAPVARGGARARRGRTSGALERAARRARRGDPLPRRLRPRRAAPRGRARSTSTPAAASEDPATGSAAGPAVRLPARATGAPGP